MKFTQPSLMSWTLALLTIPGMGFSTLAWAQSPPPEVLAWADTVLYNGQVLTVDDSFTIGEAVAIRDSKFLAVGDSERIRAMAGPETRLIDLDGKTVVPGFIDTHTHFHNYAQRGLMPRVLFRTREQWLGEIQRLVEGAEPGEWVILRADRIVDQPWAQSAFSMTRHDLDPISPDNPVFVWTSPPGNDALINSYALRLARMPADISGLVKDPATGEPTGFIDMEAYGRLFYEIIPRTPVEELVPLYKATMRRFNAVGKVTIMGRNDGHAISVFKRLWEQDELTIRFRVAHEFARNAYRPEAIIKRVGNLSGFGDAWLKIVAANVGNPDGALGNGRGWTRNPKLPEAGHAPDPDAPDFGFVPYYQDHEGSDWKTIPIFSRYGWRILGIHTAGDRSIDELFSAFEVANQERSLAGRGWAFDHSLMVRPEHIATAQRLDLIASANANSIGNKTLIRLYGADEVYKISPTRSLLDAGLRVVMEAPGNTDQPPLYHIERFVTRKDEDGRVWNEAEKITRREALYMSTNWAAYYTGDEKILGSIEPGKLADLVVIDGDYLTVPEDEIGELQIPLTMVDGRIVFEAE
jgi:predicted amidohydrolase YtcJ